jgi:hypothetical protein
MSDPLDLDAIEAKIAIAEERRVGGGLLRDLKALVAELRTARAERDALKAQWEAWQDCAQCDEHRALAARIEAAVARCRDSIMDRAVEPHAKAQARYVLRVLVDAQTPEDMAAALSGATEPAEGSAT